MTVPREVIDRVRARLRQDAESLPIEAAIARVQASADSLHAVARSIPIERFDDAPATGGWSPAKVLAHAVESNVRRAQPDPLCSAQRRTPSGRTGDPAGRT